MIFIDSGRISSVVLFATNTFLKNFCIFHLEFSSSSACFSRISQSHPESSYWMLSAQRTRLTTKHVLIFIDDGGCFHSSASDFDDFGFMIVWQGFGRIVFVLLGHPRNRTWYKSVSEKHRHYKSFCWTIGSELIRKSDERKWIECRVWPAGGRQIQRSFRLSMSCLKGDKHKKPFLHRNVT